MELTGLFVGIVEKNNDPERLGRVKVRVPHVYGATGSQTGAIGIDNLPWALPIGVPAGGSGASGGISWLPDQGDQVVVTFLDGEPEKPVWMWMMQTKDQSEKLPLHLYSNDGGKVGHPKRSALTRYGHLIEFNLGSVILSTLNGYRMVLNDDDDKTGSISISTALRNSLELDDSTNTATLQVNEDFQMNVGNEILALCDNIRFNALSGGFDVTCGGQISLLAEETALIQSTGDMVLTTGADLSFISDGILTITSTDLIYLTSTIAKIDVLTDFQVRASTIAIGSGPENELLSSLAELVVMLGTVVVPFVSPDGPNMPIASSPQWPAVMAIMGKIQSFTGKLT